MLFLKNMYTVIRYTTLVCLTTKTNEDTHSPKFSPSSSVSGSGLLTVSGSQKARTPPTNANIPKVAGGTAQWV